MPTDRQILIDAASAALDADVAGDDPERLSLPWGDLLDLAVKALTAWLSSRGCDMAPAEMRAMAIGEPRRAERLALPHYKAEVKRTYPGPKARILNAGKIRRQAAKLARDQIAAAKSASTQEIADVVAAAKAEAERQS